jgi:hypothetical protein
MQGTRQQPASSLLRNGNTYTKVLDVCEDLIVESEVIAGNDVDTGLLLDVPVLETKSLCLSKEIILRELTAPVRLCRDKSQHTMWGKCRGVNSYQ